MEDILRGFTMFVDNVDHGLSIEELELPNLSEIMDTVRSGGMDLSVDVPVGGLEPFECSVKMVGQGVTMQKLMAHAPGMRKTFTFRGAAVDEISGDTKEHVVIIEGKISEGARDAWNKGERSGTDYTIKNIMYYRYEVSTQVVHEVQAWPPKRIIDGTDHLASINQALGR